MLAITGATGQLGRLVIEALLQKVPASQIVAAVRDVDKAKELAGQGIQVRYADYSQPESLRDAFAGVDKVLLISSSEVGQRVEQHRAVIEAAKAANIALLAYTSILNADRSSLMLAEEHVATEAMIQESGLPAVILRNGWYSENYTMGIPAILQHGVMIGCAGEGRICSAPRRDYAEAAAHVLTRDGQAGKIYQLAGDHGFTLAEFANMLSEATGRPIVYQNLSEADYIQALENAGVPAPFPKVLGNSETGASAGDLFSPSSDLSQLLNRATTPIEVTIKEALSEVAA
ncbi:Quinone oxidoreductase 2 [Vibrio ruber DSM 16370]|uniref:Quinone oxidoreductase 2 n=1 Tax=Vibrio ruber (strain DSM 16370 / JCM 11486 / BCRC 17186 / CECT 7878 / LMG 23124 / VR1) TaxID=1123498 RepID=A0A1R4LCS8_VIBR1|nr:SDR family oxidoreductase [Vibrio ruber]SJN54355.1 Quinone oxidoreductase 2 [Vibrio ruber DSM 16370]